MEPGRLGGPIPKLRSALHRIPSLRVIRELKKRGVDLGSLNALEIFGGEGLETRNFEPHVRALEVWEIDPVCEKPLRDNLPTARVKIVDSYQELTVTQRKFDLVLADTWTQLFGGHCEHFELFPGLFRILARRAFIVLNVVLDWNVEKLQKEYLFYDEHLKRRRDFYWCEEPARVSAQGMVKRYSNLARENGFELRWWLMIGRYLLYPLRRRSKKWRLCYLLLALEKANGSQPASARR